MFLLGFACGFAVAAALFVGIVFWGARSMDNLMAKEARGELKRF